MLTLTLSLNGPLNFCNNVEPINLKSMRSHSLRAKKISYCEGEDRVELPLPLETCQMARSKSFRHPPHPDHRQPALQTRGRHPLPPDQEQTPPGPEADTPPQIRGRHFPPLDQRQTHPWTRGRHHRPGRDGHCSGWNTSPGMHSCFEYKIKFLFRLLFFKKTRHW